VIVIRPFDGREREANAASLAQLGRELRRRHGDSRPACPAADGRGFRFAFTGGLTSGSRFKLRS
jgi:hypothetical protein